MNNSIKISIVLKLILVSFLINSCSKEVKDENVNFPVLNPLRTDTNAGTWKPILLTNPSEINCPAPIAINSTEYKAQLAEIKSLQANISETDKVIMRHWSASAVVRWNEIMRELVAKNNLAPAANPDGTYPAPNAANPFAYPIFPFSNPPYAARAYAYLSAAQYDAIIVAYYYKSQYKRPYPEQLDASIQPYFSNTSGSSYPSEDAAVIGASVEILKLMFPADIDFINQKAVEHYNARLMGGVNVRSDMDAGMQIGKDVASKFITRAKSDKAGTAGGNAAIWENLKQQAINRGEIPWISQESPPRPPMLAVFGSVTPFLFNSTTIATTIRPIAPPSTSSEKFKDELAEVYQVTSNLTREQERIANFWSDGVRTYTPPGHWNYIASTDFIFQNFSEPRMARNLALLNMSMMDAAIVCWDAKMYYYNPRPMQMDTRIKTIVGCPNFPAYISGHSTFSGAAATVLGYIIPQYAQKYTDMAKEASESRIYGGIHYRSDCEVGLVTGAKVGNYAIQRGRIDGAE